MFGNRFCVKFDSLKSMGGKERKWESLEIIEENSKAKHCSNISSFQSLLFAELILPKFYNILYLIHRNKCNKTIMVKMAATIIKITTLMAILDLHLSKITTLWQIIRLSKITMLL